MSRRQSSDSGSSPVLPRAVAAARGAANLANNSAARGSPHARRKFAVNGGAVSGSGGGVTDYQVILAPKNL
jgi:hypothetical protein